MFQLSISNLEKIKKRKIQFEKQKLLVHVICKYIKVWCVTVSVYALIATWSRFHVNMPKSRPVVDGSVHVDSCTAKRLRIAMAIDPAARAAPRARARADRVTGRTALSACPHHAHPGGTARRGPGLGLGRSRRWGPVVGGRGQQVWLRRCSTVLAQRAPSRLPWAKLLQWPRPHRHHGRRASSRQNGHRSRKNQ